MLDLGKRKVFLSCHVEFNEFLNTAKRYESDVLFTEVNEQNVHNIETHEQSNLCLMVSDLFTDQYPELYREAMKSPEAEKWEVAANIEFNSLVSNSTWTVVKRPHNVKVISCRWVFTKKFNNKGNAIYKVKLVARDFQQDRGFNFEDVYSPVAKLSTVRTLLVISNEHKH